MWTSSTDIQTIVLYNRVARYPDMITRDYQNGSRSGGEKLIIYL